jgi:hypothetical protein
VDVEGHVNFFRGSRELFVSDSVWWSLFEGYELGIFCKSLDVECSSSAYDYGIILMPAFSVPWV